MTRLPPCPDSAVTVPDGLQQVGGIILAGSLREAPTHVITWAFVWARPVTNDQFPVCNGVSDLMTCLHLMKKNVRRTDAPSSCCLQLWLVVHLFDDIVLMPVFFDRSLRR